jgi:hypothetical protein
MTATAASGVAATTTSTTSACERQGRNHGSQNQNP